MTSNGRFAELGLPDQLDKIADETIATDPQEIRAFMEKVGHPALAMEDMAQYARQAEAPEPAVTTASPTVAPTAAADAGS